MGKSKKRSRASKSRLNPMNGPNKVNSKDDSLVTNKLQPLLKKLESAIPNDRAMALASISVLCEDSHMRKLLLKQKLVHIVMSRLLSDDNTDIVVESYGLLRNLSLEEGYDVSIYLWRSDIWTSIIQGFNKLIDSMHALEKKDKHTVKNNKAATESKRLLFDYADNLLSLVVGLANGSDDILEEILKTDKINAIFTVMKTLIEYGLDKLPTTVSNSILDLIYDFSSESFDFIESLSQNPFLSDFVRALPNMTDLKPFNELSKVLIQGIHLQFLDLNMTYEQANAIIHSTCSFIKDIDMDQVESVLFNQSNDEELLKTDDAKVAEKIKSYTKERLTAFMKLQSVEIAIDIITAIIELIATIYEEGQKKIPHQLHQTITEFLPHVFEKLGSKFTSRVLIAWNNLLWLYLTLDENFLEFSGEPYKNLWSFINSISENDLDLKLGKLSVTWALLRTLIKQSDCIHWLTQFNLANNTNFVNSLIDNYNTDLNDSSMSIEDILELGQRYCGVLSTYALFQGQIEINRIVGRFILDQLVSNTIPAPLLLDFSNALFELYGDGNFDYDKPVFVQDNFLQIIENQIIPNLRDRFKFVDKNKDSQLKTRCNECLGTLESFVEYKKKE